MRVLIYYYIQLYYEIFIEYVVLYTVIDKNYSNQFC